MILLLKRLIFSFLQLLLLILNRYPVMKRFCIYVVKKIGLYDLLSRSQLRLKGRAKALVLSRHERAIFDEINHFLENKDIPSRTDYHNKKRLAFVSPLPPLRSGISDYSADLLPLLAEHYVVDVIVDQDVLTDSWIKSHCIIRTADWLLNNPTYYDRVIYHFGNSPFHVYMFDLIDKVPGVIVLHDFYLGHLVNNRYHVDFVRQLYRSHGYKAVEELHQSKNRDSSIWAYPLNIEIIQKALKIIVHSTNSQRLATQFYGENIADNWAVIPLLRAPADMTDRIQSRSTLSLNTNSFVVCSYGLTGPIKLNHELLEAWLASDLAKSEQCELIFVGENEGEDYGKSLLARINDSGLASRIHITGWVNNLDYKHYLCAADIGVQLRTRSRGETSAAVLDCMNYGLATIINAHGAMHELAEDIVFKLPDEFSISELTQALNTLWKDKEYRQQLSTNAKAEIERHHQPQHCAKAYITAIESAYFNTNNTLEPLLTVVDSVGFDVPDTSDEKVRKLAKSIARAYPPHSQPRQLLIDISAMVVEDLKTGIQRVVRAQLEQLLRRPPKGIRVEPVYLSDEGGQWHFNYAHHWTSQFLGLTNEINPTDEAVSFSRNDVLFCADLCTGLVVHADNAAIYQNLISSGVHVYFQVFDLLPISHPLWFPPEAESAHIAWANVVAKCNALCISKAVAEEFKAWCNTMQITPPEPRYFHLGADIDTSVPSLGMPDNAQTILAALTSLPSFLMVGTIEPRKGQEQTLAAIELLWQQGMSVSLVIVGKAGWMVDTFVSKLVKHPERNRHLFWLESISDEFLNKVYQASHCLIAASEGEGFGLPLIEAAQHGLPIIARDIPVFREVAGEFAYYFEGLKAEDLASSITKWLDLRANNTHPMSSDMPWLTWQQSTQKLVHLLDLKEQK